MRELLLLLVAGAMMSFSTTTNNDWCTGFDDGYQQALEDCLMVGVTPVCPIQPVGVRQGKEYQSGFGRGYASGSKKCN